MQFYTGKYDNCKSPKAISISNNVNESTGFDGECILEVIPRDNFEQTMMMQRMILSKEEYMRFYTETYYERILRDLNPSIVFGKLHEGSILVSEDEPMQFNYRHIVACWLELFLGIDVREVKVLEDGSIKKLPRSEYYSTIKGMLEILIKDNIDMHGYTTIAAAYAYENAMHLKSNEEIGNYVGITDSMLIALADLLEKNGGTFKM